MCRRAALGGEPSGEAALLQLHVLVVPVAGDVGVCALT